MPSCTDFHRDLRSLASQSHGDYVNYEDDTDGEKSHGNSPHL